MPGEVSKQLNKVHPLTSHKEAVGVLFRANLGTGRRPGQAASDG